MHSFFRALPAWTPVLCCAVSVVFFVLWLARTDWFFFHFTGPPRYLIVAFAGGVIAVISGLICIGIPRLRKLRPALLGLCVIAGAVVILVTSTQLANALAELRRQHLQSVAGDASSVPELIAALHDRNWYVRNQAVMELARVGPSAHSAVPALVAVLQDPAYARPDAPGSGIRSSVVYTLGAIGPSASPAACPALLLLLSGCRAPLPGTRPVTNDPDGYAVTVRPTAPGIADHHYSGLCVNATEALTKIGRGCVPPPSALLSDSDASTRWHAVRAMSRLRAQDPSVTPSLEHAAHDPADRVRQAAEAALLTTRK